MVHVQSPAHLNGAATLDKVALVNVKPSACTVLSAWSAGTIHGELRIWTWTSKMPANVPVTTYVDPEALQVASNGNVPCNSKGTLR